MAKSPFNSPLVQIIWTDAVSGNKRSTFARNDPLELRFGVQFQPSFWTSFESAQFWLVVTTFRAGMFLNRYVLDDSIQSLPGAPASQLWVGMRFGRAGQLSDASGTLTFRGELWIARQGGASNDLDQWAMAPHEHAFLYKLFDFDGPSGSESLNIVGGPGTPPGTPTS